MSDEEKLKYDLAMQSALAATILNRNSGESVAAQVMREFAAAYGELEMSSQVTELSTQIRKLKQRHFEQVNSPSKRNL